MLRCVCVACGPGFVSWLAPSFHVRDSSVSLAAPPPLLALRARATDVGEDKAESASRAEYNDWPVRDVRPHPTF